MIYDYCKMCRNYSRLFGCDDCTYDHIPEKSKEGLCGQYYISTRKLRKELRRIRRIQRAIDKQAAYSAKQIKIGNRANGEPYRGHSKLTVNRVNAMIDEYNKNIFK